MVALRGALYTIAERDHCHRLEPGLKVIPREPKNTRHPKLRSPVEARGRLCWNDYAVQSEPYLTTTEPLDITLAVNMQDADNWSAGEEPSTRVGSQRRESATRKGTG